VTDESSTGYHYPDCDVTTENLRTLHRHWMNVHPKQGPFAHVTEDIEVGEV
jgi:uncharacterized protein YfaT (DUF1175 family)